MIKALMEIANNELILKDIYHDLAQPGVRKVGQALETTLDLANTILLPVKLINEKSRLIFTNNLDSYKEKLSKHDLSEITVVPPEIGIPILDKLTYYTNDELSNLFINLLLTSSLTESSNYSHPCYVKIIESLSPDEARILMHISKNSISSIPFIYFIAKVKDEAKPNDYIRDMFIKTGLEEKIDLIVPENINVYLENLISLSLVEFIDDKVDPNCNPEYKVLKDHYSDAFEAFK